MIDACFSGTSAGGTLLRGSPVRLRLQRTSPLLLLSNSVVLSASASDEVAWWDDKAKLGLFTRHVLEGLSGAADKDEFGNDDGKVTLAELRKFLKEELTYRARRRYGQDQHPQVRGEMSRVMHSLR